MKKFSVLPPYPMMRADFVVLTLLSKNEDIPKHQRERLKRLVERLNILKLNCTLSIPQQTKIGRAHV